MLKRIGTLLGLFLFGIGTTILFNEGFKLGDDYLRKDKLVDLKNASYKLYVGSDREQGSCTSTLIKNMGNESFHLTAAHCCDTIGGDLSLEERAAGPLIPATIVAKDNYADLCLIVSQRIDREPIKVSKRISIEYGTSIHFIGNPSGIDDQLSYGQMTESLVVDGYLFNNTSILGYKGASGSAVVNAQNEIVGVLVRGLMVGPNWVRISSLLNVQEFLRNNLPLDEEK